MTRAACGEIKPFIVMEVLERALELEREGRSIIHMEIGEPDFDTPAAVIEAAKRSLDRGDTHYTDSRGIPELRDAVARWYNGRYDCGVTPSQVLVTMGVSPALLLVLSCMVDGPGDEVILGNPCYPCYPNFVRYLGGTPRFIATRGEDGFQLRPDDVKGAIGPDTRAVVINSPANPMGTLIAPGDLEEICGLGLPVISDEIYHGLVYGEKEHSALEFTKEAWVLNGFSKLFAMTGWRLGYVIMPEERIRQMQILQQNFFISPSSFVQKAAVTALDREHPEIPEMIEKYDRRRRYLLERLPELGLEYAVEPKGAFYIFVRTDHIDPDSFRLAFDILERAGVALAPGIDFGERGEGHLRISYANSLENIKEGMDRLERYLKERGQGMKKLIAAALAAVILVPSAAAAFPLGFEVKGGVGIGYYSMAELDANTQAVREHYGLEFDDFDSEFNVMLEGRIWMFGRFAATAGYEHLWAEYYMPVGSSNYVTYKMPADILSLGGTLHIYEVPKVIDINAGVKGDFAKVSFGTDQDGRYTEYKSNDYGWDIYGEINTNFLNPVQVGFTLGYRNLKVDGFEDKYGNTPYFIGTGEPVVLDYSGMYFYFTVGVAIW